MTPRTISNHTVKFVGKTVDYSNAAAPLCDIVNKNFFSIVLPTYNRAHLLERALASVAAQEESSWELIVVDDGSTDGTASLLETWQHKDRRIRVISHPHCGLARSRKAGIAASCGEFVTFLDSDDAYAPPHLRIRRTLLNAIPMIDLLHGGVTVIGDPFVVDKFNPSTKIPLSDCVIGGSFVMARRLLDKIPWPDVAYGDDNAFYQRAVAAGAMITTTDAPTYIYYRGESDSLCSIVEAGGIEAAVKFQQE